MKKSTVRTLITALLAAIAFTYLAGGSILFAVRSSLNDFIYQNELPASGEIVIVGIDPQSATDLGSYFTWDRDIVASVIEILNQDAQSRPAVIGVDIVYAGYSDEYVDSYLVETAGQYGNVVLAMFAESDETVVINDNGEFYMDTNAFGIINEPFDELREVTYQGHINAMNDTDGVLRHALHYITLPDGRTAPAFNTAVAEIYAGNAGASLYVPPYNSNGFYYIPYTAKSGNFEVISLSSVLFGDVDTDWLADKIVLIGPYDAALGDSVTTSIDPGRKMFGIEVQANLIESQLSGIYKREVSKTPQLIALFILSFASLVFFWDRKILWATIVWVAVAGGYLFMCMILYELGYVLDALMIPLAVTALYIVTVALNYVRAALARKKVTNTFMRYVAPEVVREILKEGTDALALGGKLTHIAVLFVDIRGFTPMSEVLSAPQVVEILNRYLTLTSTCIFNNNGTLDKFIGDATMAIWNAPLPQDDYVYKAVKTALDMVAMSTALGDELFQLYGRSVNFGIGVHCGDAVVGNIGASARMDYTAIGDTVNTAARLESNAMAGQVLVSEDVVRELGDRIRVTSLGNTIKLKGKSDSFEIFSVDGLAE